MSKHVVISGQYFPVFGLNTEIYGVNIRIQLEYGKIRTRNNYVFGHFSRSEKKVFLEIILFSFKSINFIGKNPMFMQ